MIETFYSYPPPVIKLTTPPYKYVLYNDDDTFLYVYIYLCNIPSLRTITMASNAMKMALLKQEQSYLKKKLFCTKCSRQKVACVNLPCGHVVYCQPCGDKETTCMICKKKIKAIANIYVV